MRELAPGAFTDFVLERALARLTDDKTAERVGAVALRILQGGQA